MFLAKIRHLTLLLTFLPLSILASVDVIGQVTVKESPDIEGTKPVFSTENVNGHRDSLTFDINSDYTLTLVATTRDPGPFTSGKGEFMLETDNGQYRFDRCHIEIQDYEIATRGHMEFFFKVKPLPYTGLYWFERDACENIWKNGVYVKCEQLAQMDCPREEPKPSLIRTN